MARVLHLLFPFLGGLLLNPQDGLYSAYKANRGCYQQCLMPELQYDKRGFRGGEQAWCNVA